MMRRRKTVKAPQAARVPPPRAGTALVKPSRAPPAITRLFLYVQAGGRCEFDNCNEYLLEHAPTGSPGNFAEQAHIWAFREGGPRGRGNGRPKNLHGLRNLMLLCKACHHRVDTEPQVFTVEVLRKFKKDHEDRIHGLTGLSKDRDTVPLVLKGLIAGRVMDISDDDMQRAVAPNYLRLREKIEIDLTHHRDSADPSYWTSAKTTIDEGLQQLSRIKPRGNRSSHVSIFALAAIPVLAYLGSKLSDKVRVDLYQRHRNPESWNWHEGQGNARFALGKISQGHGPTGLAINVSGTIPMEAIKATADESTLYELRVSGQEPTPLVLNTREDLTRFVTAYVRALETIRAAHPGLELLHVFPAVPAPVAISLGRHILPKVGPRLLIYDHDKRSGSIFPILTVG
ncbi:MAG TPA: SAVED domain-containing protein [Steroidobacteraceae bacterium]|jgi:hypothetical protein|nr:SAVED domain-containing protein [Steroidobacteraceae bacterium]